MSTSWKFLFGLVRVTRGCVMLFFLFVFTVRRSAQCPSPLIYADCDVGEKGLECARTCQNLDLPCVSLACIPGCLCPPGTVRDVL